MRINSPNSSRPSNKRTPFPSSRPRILPLPRAVSCSDFLPVVLSWFDSATHARTRPQRTPPGPSAMRCDPMQLIFPSYDRLKDAGLLGKKPPTKPNFFAARILADEALASKVRCGAVRQGGEIYWRVRKGVTGRDGGVVRRSGGWGGSRFVCRRHGAAAGGFLSFAPCMFGLGRRSAPSPGSLIGAQEAPRSCTYQNMATRVDAEGTR